MTRRQPRTRRLRPARPVPERSSTTTAPLRERQRRALQPGPLDGDRQAPRLPDAAARLETISFGGPSALVEAMHGTADDRVVHGRRHAGAGGARPLVARRGLADQHADRGPGRPVLEDGQLTMTFRAGAPQSYAGISPTDLPAVVPGAVRAPYATSPTGSRPARRALPGVARPGPGRVRALPRAVRHAHRLHGVHPQRVAGQQRPPTSTSGPAPTRRSAVLGALAARGSSQPTTEAETKHAARPGRVRPGPAALRRGHRAGDPARARRARGQPRRPAARPGGAMPPRCAWSG